MVRVAALEMVPAAAAFSALAELSVRLSEGAPADAALPLGMARSLTAARRREGRRPASLRVPAGAATEVFQGPRSGSPLLAPAPGSVPGLDEVREGLSIFRPVVAGRVEGRELSESDRVVISRRAPARGELAVVADHRAVRIVTAGPHGILPAGVRLLGSVEAIVREASRRRCA